MGLVMAVVAWAILGLLGLLTLVALTNVFLMLRPKLGPGTDLSLVALIPARNEAENLQRLLPSLAGHVDKVYVFDDESTDGTAKVAASLGARVIRASEPLPPGWTGKNWACHRLAQIASEDAEAEWWVFLDADTEPRHGFGAGLRSLAATAGRRAPCITGFPNMRPGRGFEPVALAWVPYILLATIPFGLIQTTRAGHARFTNGQVVMWRASRYAEVWPHEAVKDEVLEDVGIGRLLAKRRVPVAVADLHQILTVRMYETAQQAVDGMTKNSYAITGSAAGSYALALFFLLLGWGWCLAGAWWPVALGLLLFSRALTMLVTGGAWWSLPLMPVSCTVAAWTLVRSVGWMRRGKLHWKGREYPPAASK